jgi:hypothetical protein
VREFARSGACTVGRGNADNGRVNSSRDHGKTQKCPRAY